MPASALSPAAVADAPGDGDQPAPQPGARLVAGVAVHEDLAAAHAGARARRRRRRAGGPAEPRTTRRPPRISAPAQSPASPSTTSSPPRMPAPVCGARVARDRQAAAGHARAEAVTRRRSPSTRTSSLPSPDTANRSPTRRAAVAVPELEPLDLGRAPAPASRSGRERLGVDRRGRRLAQRQRQRHGTSSLSVEVVRAEVAAVVAGGELRRARPRRRLEPDAASPRAPARAPSPSITISNTEPTPVGHLACRRPARAASGTATWLVEAISGLVARADLAAAARDPARERQDRALARRASRRPPPRPRRSAVATSAARMMMLPPPTPSTIAEALLRRGTRPPSPGSASSAGRRAPCSPASRRRRSAAGRRRRPSSSASRPLKQAVVGQVSTVWPTRSTSRLPRPSAVGGEQQRGDAGAPVGRLRRRRARARSRPRTCSR